MFAAFLSLPFTFQAETFLSSNCPAIRPPLIFENQVIFVHPRFHFPQCWTPLSIALFLFPIPQFGSAPFFPIHVCLILQMAKISGTDLRRSKRRVFGLTVPQRQVLFLGFSTGFSCVPPYEQTQFGRS